MHWAKQAVMSLDKKHEKPQSNTASLTMSPSLHNSSKSLVLHCAKDATGFVKESAIHIKPMTPKEEKFMTYKRFCDTLGSIPHRNVCCFSYSPLASERKRPTGLRTDGQNGC